VIDTSIHNELADIDREIELIGAEISERHGQAAEATIRGDTAEVGRIDKVIDQLTAKQAALAARRDARAAELQSARQRQREREDAIARAQESLDNKKAALHCYQVWITSMRGRLRIREAQAALAQAQATAAADVLQLVPGASNMPEALDMIRGTSDRLTRAGLGLPFHAAWAEDPRNTDAIEKRIAEYEAEVKRLEGEIKKLS
jgi:hypothetical protein